MCSIIINKLNITVDQVITKLNTLNIFNKSLHILPIDNSHVSFNKTNVLINLSFNIDLSQFKKFVKHTDYFTLNDTNYTDIISINYKDRIKR